MLRQQNKLKHGKKKIKIPGVGECDYDGEMDESGNCVGVGTATDEFGTKWRGTWLNN